jgi:hypothetical protein
VESSRGASWQLLRRVIVVVVIAGVALTVVGLSMKPRVLASSEQVLFFEDWEDTVSVPNLRWSSLPMSPWSEGYGEAEIVPNGNPGRCFRPLTIAGHWGSMFAANEFLPDFSSGLRLEMDFIFLGGPTHYQDAWIGLVDPANLPEIPLEYWANDGNGLWAIRLRVGGEYSDSPSNTISPNVWHTAGAIIYPDGTVEGELDGLTVVTSSTQLDMSLSGQLAIWIGGNTRGMYPNWGDVCIDNVRVSTLAPPVLTASIDIDPDTLNLKSNGRWMTAYIELPEGYDVADIDVSTVLLQGTLAAEIHPTTVGDNDHDGVADRMVKFSRQDLIVYLVENGLTSGNITLMVSGEVDNAPFEGMDIVRVK